MNREKTVTDVAISTGGTAIKWPGDETTLCSRGPIIEIEGEDGKQVMIVKDGEISEREVKTGIENELYTEITQGLNEGEEVLQNPTQNKGDI